MMSNANWRLGLLAVKRKYEQVIDTTGKDVVLESGYSGDAQENARFIAGTFREFIEKNKNEITALQVRGALWVARRMPSCPHKRAIPDELNDWVLLER